MFGFNSPTPRTITTRPAKKSCGGPGIASIRLPTVIIVPPASTARCAPIRRSAIHPPGSAAMNTAAVYRP